MKAKELGKLLMSDKVSEDADVVFFDAGEDTRDIKGVTIHEDAQVVELVWE